MWKPKSDIIQKQETEAEKQSRMKISAVESFIENIAKQHGYSSAVSLVSYVNSTNKEWAREAATFNKWRDEVWSYVYKNIDKDALNISDFIKSLPKIKWASTKGK